MEIEQYKPSKAIQEQSEYLMTLRSLHSDYRKRVITTAHLSVIVYYAFSWKVSGSNPHIDTSK